MLPSTLRCNFAYQATGSQNQWMGTLLRMSLQLQQASWHCGYTRRKRYPSAALSFRVRTQTKSSLPGQSHSRALRVRHHGLASSLANQPRLGAPRLCHDRLLRPHRLGAMARFSQQYRHQLPLSSYWTTSRQSEAYQKGTQSRGLIAKNT
jgi:hypothetical protein